MMGMMVEGNMKEMGRYIKRSYEITAVALMNKHYSNHHRYHPLSMLWMDWPLSIWLYYPMRPSVLSFCFTPFLISFLHLHLHLHLYPIISTATAIIITITITITTIIILSHLHSKQQQLLLLLPFHWHFLKGWKRCRCRYKLPHCSHLLSFPTFHLHY